MKTQKCLLLQNLQKQQEIPLEKPLNHNDDTKHGRVIVLMSQ